MLQKGYGTAKCLLMVAPNNCILCSFVFRKVRPATLKSVSIPRLKLVATTSATQQDSSKKDMVLLHICKWLHLITAFCAVLCLERQGLQL